MARSKPIFVIPHPIAAIAVGSLKTGSNGDHLARHEAIGLTWRSDGNSNVWARGTIDQLRDIDFCSVISANALAATQIRLRLGTTQVEVDGGSAPYDSGAVDFIDPSITRSDGLYHSHLELSTPENALWFRIDITDHTGDFEAAHLVLGKKIEPSHFYDPNSEFSTDDLGTLELSRWGVPDETPGLIFRSLTFTLSWQSEAEFETSFRPMMEQLGARGVIYCCFDPAATTYRQARTYMGWLKRPPFARGVVKPATFSQEFSIVSMI